MLRHRQYRLSDDAREQLRELVSSGLQRELVPSNAWLVRNIIERAIRRQALRLVQRGEVNRDELMLITSAELEGLRPDEGMPDPW